MDRRVMRELLVGRVYKDLKDRRVQQGRRVNRVFGVK
jgi:hypothetical protein